MSSETKTRITPLTLTELAQIAGDLQPLVGAQLQDGVQTANELGLAFYHQGSALWLWFDLSPLRPLILRYPGKPPAGRKKIQRPLLLFLRSRFFGRRLKSVQADVQRGRILVFDFHRAADERTSKGTEEPCRIEARLFPHGQNLIAIDGQSRVAENKPKDVPPPQPHTESEPPRRWEEIESAIQAASQRREPTGGAISDAAKLEDAWKKAIAKKEKALERMREELNAKTSTLPSEIGEWLKANATLDVRPEWREWVDASKSLAWNIENLFHRAKENRRKAEGTEARLATVAEELARLRSNGPQAFGKARAREEATDAKSLLVQAEARGRRFKLADDLEVYVGKSAADNLRLLRGAQPFDYWLHLRERPGSHAILRRTRTRVVSDAEFMEAGRWVVEQSLNKRVSELKGERFDLLIVECRYVRPIKGEAAGRVNYTHDRVLRLSL